MEGEKADPPIQINPQQNVAHQFAGQQIQIGAQQIQVASQPFQLGNQTVHVQQQPGPPQPGHQMVGTQQQLQQIQVGQQHQISVGQVQPVGHHVQAGQVVQQSQTPQGKLITVPGIPGHFIQVSTLFYSSYNPISQV